MEGLGGLLDTGDKWEGTINLGKRDVFFSSLGWLL